MFEVGDRVEIVEVLNNNASWNVGDTATWSGTDYLENYRPIPGYSMFAQFYRFKKIGENEMLKEPTFYVDELARQIKNLNGRNPIVKITGIDMGKGFIYHKHTREIAIMSGDYKSFEKIPIEIGDKVRCAETRIEFVVNCIDGYFCSGRSCEKGTFYTEKKNTILIEKGGTMSKYETIREKIRNLNDGWNKDADDVLEEMRYYLGGCFAPYLMIAPYNSGNIYIKNTENRTYAEFNFNTQCEKHTAFKKALLWLLNHSEIKNIEKQEKVRELQDKVNDLQRQINELVK